MKNLKTYELGSYSPGTRTRWAKSRNRVKHKRVLKDYYSSVRAALARNIHTSEATRLTLANDSSTTVVQALLTQPQLSGAVLNAVFNNSYMLRQHYEVSADLATRSDLTLDLQVKLMTVADRASAAKLTENQHLTIEGYEQLLELSIKGPVEPWSWNLIENLLVNPMVNRSIFKKCPIYFLDTIEAGRQLKYDMLESAQPGAGHVFDGELEDGPGQTLGELLELLDALDA